MKDLINYIKTLNKPSDALQQSEHLKQRFGVDDKDIALAIGTVEEEWLHWDWINRLAKAAWFTPLTPEL